MKGEGPKGPSLGFLLLDVKSYVKSKLIIFKIFNPFLRERSVLFQVILCGPFCYTS